MGEWQQGLEVAREQGIIDEAMQERLLKLQFEHESTTSKFPMRIALIVLGAILLVSAGFAIFVRVLGDDPSELVIAGVL
ncbi:MAG: hypothetical protein EB142_07155, partial [Actinobacteria bacterium]|nr:hypothetical protein [Actinomycetota bacterium]